eukprot:TRINITY_DN11285_c1_g2_i2.p1 TRINITY_DN11285_c1_g2~~TRINITY_DN11285_c1_g2_i2.p1  ORF type:complete len:109 (-),score=8.45 TRINITY_DN11285_c1_g2_i2:414-740(-)
MLVQEARSAATSSSGVENKQERVVQTQANILRRITGVQQARQVLQIPNEDAVHLEHLLIGHVLIAHVDIVRQHLRENHHLLVSKLRLPIQELVQKLHRCVILKVRTIL